MDLDTQLSDVDHISTSVGPVNDCDTVSGPYDSAVSKHDTGLLSSPSCSLSQDLRNGIDAFLPTHVPIRESSCPQMIFPTQIPAIVEDGHVDLDDQYSIPWSTPTKEIERIYNSRKNDLAWNSYRHRQGRFRLQAHEDFLKLWTYGRNNIIDDIASFNATEPFSHIDQA